MSQFKNEINDLPDFSGEHEAAEFLLHLVYKRSCQWSPLCLNYRRLKQHHNINFKMMLHQQRVDNTVTIPR